MRIWNDPGFEPEVGSLATFPIHEIWSQSVCKFYEVSCKSLNIFANYSFRIKVTNKHDVALKYTCMGLHSYNRLCNINPRQRVYDTLKSTQSRKITRNFHISLDICGGSSKRFEIFEIILSLRKLQLKIWPLARNLSRGTLIFFWGLCTHFAPKNPWKT